MGGAECVQDASVDALGDEQVEELRRWAVGLATDPRPEVKAAAKAIHLLSEDLLAARSQLLEERMIRQALEERDAFEEAEAELVTEEVPRDLLLRLRTLLRLGATPHEA